MECLSIPIDHRLRQLIRKALSINANGDSEHIRILQRFGKSLKNGQSDYFSTYDLSFGLELARPESKAGVVVVLLRTHSTQDNSDGFLAERHTCALINAVSDLISAVTNSKLDLDGISVFDAIPFLHEEVTGLEYDDLIGNAESVFADMIRAKQPNVVISCFKTETCPCPLLTQQLTCSKPIFSFDYDPWGSKQLAESGLSLIRVNASHPNYAINYHSEFSCLSGYLSWNLQRHLPFGEIIGTTWTG